MRPRTCVLTLSALTLLAVGLARPAAAAETAKPTANLIGPWQLFIDDYLVSSKKNIIRRYHPFTKYPDHKTYNDHPLIVVDKPWEAHVVNACTVLPKEDGQGYRLYYYCWSNDKTERGRSSHGCYAESKDGIKWEKPPLGLYEREGSKDNNIIPNFCGAVIPTPWETDPQKKYQGVGGMYYAYASSDGLDWKKQSDERIVSGGDTSHFYYDPNIKRFRANVKVSRDIRGLTRRCVGYSESDTLTKFPELRLVMAPDDIDDRWCDYNTVERTHFYACPVAPYETLYIGLLQIYRAEDPEGYFHGPLWLELVSSRDGIHWKREEGDRPPLLDIGKFRTFDHGMVIAPTPLLVGDELRVYYTGYDELHDLLPYQSTIAMATMRKDGFASVDADEAPGEIVTKPFANVSGGLLVNCDPRQGSLRVEVLDVDGKVLPGYAHDECEPVMADGVRQRVVWRTRNTLPTNQPVRFRFLLNHARLYSFMAGEKAKAIDEQGPPSLQALFTFEGNTEAFSDMLWDDGLQSLRILGTSRIDHKEPQPAYGQRSLVVGSQWRTQNRVEITGTQDLGRHFTLAAMVKCKPQLSRLFSAYNGNSPVNTSELIFDFDPRGRMVNGLRLFCKGVSVESKHVTFDSEKYHHLAVTYDDGEVTFYLDGESVGQDWVPGGEPVKLARNLLIGEDAEFGTDEQLQGHVDDVLVIGRVLKQEELATLATQGADVLFKIGK